MDFSSKHDPLFCQEDHFEEDETEQHLAINEMGDKEEDEDEGWADVLSSLLANEVETHPELAVASGDTYLVLSRRNAVTWVAKTSLQHGFSVQTVLLAVNYLDRCFLAGGVGGGLRLQEDKPWMARLAAVACLSLAAKLDETRVPLLLDLQVPPFAAGEEMGYVFENRTIRRMELLLLSTLGWRMNPVTPLSLARRLLHKIPAASGRRREVFGRCEAALLAVVADLGWVRYPPSVWAAAALVYAVRPPGEITGTSPDMDTALDFLNVSKERVGGAYQLIVTGDSCGIKRKHFYQKHCGSDSFYSSSGSPNCPVGSCFTCENSSSSGDSLPSSFRELPLLKKPKTKQVTDNGESNELVIEHGVLA